MAINNIHTFDNTQTGIWTAWSDISMNNSNIFNNNSYWLSIANQANGTLIKNIQFYKNQYGHLIANWNDSRSWWNLYSTSSSCSYCEIINTNDVENKKYTIINNSNWNYIQSWRNNIESPEDINISYWSVMNTQLQPMQYYYRNWYYYWVDGVEYFNSSDYIWIFQPVVRDFN